MKLLLKKSEVSNIFEVLIKDSSVATGAGLTGLAYNSSGLNAYYYRNTAASAVAITLADMTLGTFTSGGFKEVSTNMPGLYAFCPPNAAFTSASSVTFVLKGATNMAPVEIECQLLDWDIQVGAMASVTGNVAGNVTGSVASVLGNVAGNVTGSVASVLGNVAGNVTGSVNSVVGDVGGKVNGNIVGNVLGTVHVIAATTIALIVDNVWDEAQSGHTTPGSFGYFLDQRISTKPNYNWDHLTSAGTTTGSYGKKLTDWALGTDNRALISANTHTTGISIINVKDII
jgi:hypothetical protein